MSRGPGKTQRAIIAALQASEQRQTTQELAEAVYGPTPSESEGRATRRAIAGLAARDIVDVRMVTLKWRTATQRRWTYTFRGDCDEPCRWWHFETDQRRTTAEHRLVTDPLKAGYSDRVVTPGELADAKRADRGRGVHIVTDFPYVEVPCLMPVPGHLVQLKDERFHREVAAEEVRRAAFAERMEALEARISTV